MTWNLNVPKVLHLYWGKNKPLTYLRYLTVTSFLHHNPDWEVKIYSPLTTSTNCTWRTNEQSGPVYTGEDYFEHVCNLKRVRTFKVDFFQLHPKAVDLPEVHKSDLLRLYLLSTQGGAWSDFDVFYFKPITEINLNHEETHNFSIGLYMFPDPNGYTIYSIGLLLATPGPNRFSELLTFALKRLSDNASSLYQAYGANLLEDYFMDTQIILPFMGHPKGIYNIAQRTIFPVDAFRITDLYSTTSTLNLTNCLGVHWFGGHPGVVNMIESKMLNEDDIERLSDMALVKVVKDNLPPEQFKDVKYSFIMPYFKRAGQLWNTLKSFEHFYGDRDDYEVIIVEDIKQVADKNEHDRLLHVIRSVIPNRIVHITAGELNQHNPSTLFNKGVRTSNGKYLIITNPECVHTVNILKELDTLYSQREDIYIVCGCLSTQSNNEYVDKYTSFNYIPSHWYQHSQYRNSLFHFCASLSRENYFKIGGFDEEFAKGIDFDDNDFRDAIICGGLTPIVRDDLLTVHCVHPKVYGVPNSPSLQAHNRALYERKKQIRGINSAWYSRYNILV